jgi:hypothetical protein
MARNPALYAADIQKKLGSMSGDMTPMQARIVVSQVFDNAHQSIVGAEEKIRTHDVEYWDLDAIHTQLFAGQGDVTYNWSHPFYKMVAQHDLADHETTEMLESLGIGFLAMVGVGLIVFLSGGTAAVALGAGLSVGGAVGSGIQAGMSWEKALDMATIREASVSPEYDLVSQGKVDSAMFAAILDSIFLFLDVAGVVVDAVKAARAAGKIAEGAEAGSDALRAADAAVEKQLGEEVEKAGTAARSAGDAVPESDVLTIPSRAGGKTKVSKSGILASCHSPCEFWEHKYANALSDNPDLAAQVGSIRAEVAAAGDPSLVSGLAGRVQALEEKLIEASFGSLKKAGISSDTLAALRMFNVDPTAAQKILRAGLPETELVAISADPVAFSVLANIVESGTAMPLSEMTKHAAEIAELARSMGLTSEVLGLVASGSIGNPEELKKVLKIYAGSTLQTWPLQGGGEGFQVAEASRRVEETMDSAVKAARAGGGTVSGSPGGTVWFEVGQGGDGGPIDILHVTTNADGSQSVVAVEAKMTTGGTGNLVKGGSLTGYESVLLKNIEKAHSQLQSVTLPPELTKATLVGREIAVSVVNTGQNPLTFASADDLLAVIWKEFPGATIGPAKSNGILLSISNNKGRFVFALP